MKVLYNFDVNLTSFIGGVIKYVLIILFITPPGNEVRFDIKRHQNLTGASVYEDR